MGVKFKNAPISSEEAMRRKNLKRKPSLSRQKRNKIHRSVKSVSVRSPSGLSYPVRGALGRALAER